MKKTVVIGASTNPERYAYKATVSLSNHKHEVVPVGLRIGDIKGHEILKGFPEVKNVDTVTLYVGPARQEFWYNYITSLNPKRVIFNPGTENQAFEEMLSQQGIETTRACTLVLLSTNQY